MAASSFSGGGAETVANWLAESLMAEGHDVHFWATGQKSTTPRWGLLRSADIVHAHSRSIDAMATLIGLDKAQRRFTLHHVPRRAPWLRSASLTSCPSRIVGTKIGWGEITWIPSPVLHRWKPVSIQEPRLVFVGRVAADKDWCKWLDVLAHCQKQGVIVSGLVYGDGPELTEMRRTASIESLSVRFAGWVSPDQIEVGPFDVLALTSPYEADPLVVWEALASGVAVVATPVGDLPHQTNAPWLLAATAPDLAHAATLSAQARLQSNDGSCAIGKQLLAIRHPVRVLESYLGWYDHQRRGSDT